MKYLIIKLSLLLIFSMTWELGYGQKDIPKGFICVKNQNEVIKKLKYFDEKTKTYKILDPLKLSPYHKLKYPIIKASSNSTGFFYDISKSKDLGYFVGKSKKSTSRNIPKAKVSMLGECMTEAYVDFHVKDGDLYALFIYNVITFSKTGEIMGMKGTAEIYDSRGKLVHKLENLDHNIGESSISSDGKFIGMTYGGLLDEDTQLSDPGIKIYDFKAKKYIFEFSSNENRYSIYHAIKFKDGLRFDINDKTINNSITLDGTGNINICQIPIHFFKNGLIKEYKQNGVVVKENNIEKTIPSKKYLANDKILNHDK